MQNIYDITIVGGGLIGCALAIALRNSPWRVALVEAKIPPPQTLLTMNETRSLALAYASQRILQQLALWPALATHATPIQRIHISQQGQFGTTVLEAKSLGFSAFGQVVPLSVLSQALQEKLPDIHNLSLIRPAEVTAVTQGTNNWQLCVKGETLTTALLVAADGSHSGIRRLLQLPTEQADYQQTAIVTTAAIGTAHHFTAYERFTTEGSIALLPLPQQRAGLVYITSPQKAERLQMLDDQAFLDAAQQAFGYRLGKFSELGKRQSHPLHEIIARQQTLPGLLLLGNAAHTMHPIAAQGFNLGLRDIACLAELLLNTRKLDDKALTFLTETYLQQRHKDQQQTLDFTHRLVRLFGTQIRSLSALRSLGLQLFDMLPAAKRAFCLRQMGISQAQRTIVSLL